MDEQTRASRPEPSEIGLILVHGIGEQGRFEHLDAHIRGIIGGFKRSGARVTVEIMSADSAPFHSTQDTWRGGPEASLRLLVQLDGRTTAVNVHEVWWADINEPYSVMKQVRFWFWGLSVWSHPKQPETMRTGSGVPVVKPGPSPTGWTETTVRVRLFLLGCFFLMSSLTLGVLTVAAKRLLNLNAPSLVRTFVNYLSSVKLYNQSQRRGAGLASNADFLDTLGEPPRDSIRRRMIRTICDVAANQSYQRWYILAHSQGSVVAFNGLMEPGSGWVGYLDEDRLKILRQRNMVRHGPPDTGPLVPARPIWSADGETVDRARVFEWFAGLLTYGSPLEKFVALWPGRVPVYSEAAFTPQTRWINVFDPLDSVSGVIRTWDKIPGALCPKVENLGYCASPFLLFGHVKYLDCPPASETDPYGSRLADRVADWLLRPAQGFR